MDVLNLIDQLDDLVYQAKSTRFSGQARVDREEVYALLDEIRIALPEEIKQAEWIVRERRELQREEPGNEGLRAAVDSIDGLERRPAPPPLTPAAAERVCSVIEQAEALRADAQRDAGEIDKEARRRAEAIVAEAQVKLRLAEDATTDLIREATEARAEIAALIERARVPAAALGDVLGECAGALAGRVERIHAVAAQAGPAETEAGDETPLEKAPAQPVAVALPEPVDDVPAQPVAEAPPVEPLPSSQDTQEWNYVEAVWPEPPVGGEPHLALPGPDAYVHAERLAGEGEMPSDPPPEYQASADPEPEPPPGPRGFGVGPRGAETSR